MSRAAAGLVLVALLACPSLWAQAVISAHSGMVNFVEGEAQLAGRPVKLNGAIFPDVKIGQTFSTKAGHAEILLTPGVFLRLDNHSSFRMISNKLTDTQVEILSGSALVEADEILKDNRITVKMGDSETLLLKTGLYHFNADAGQVRTFQGKAQVSAASNSTELKGGRTLLVDSSLTPDKFNKKKSKDELYAWSAAARLPAGAGQHLDRPEPGIPEAWSASLWAWDPWYGHVHVPSSLRLQLQTLRNGLVQPGDRLDMCSSRPTRPVMAPLPAILPGRALRPRAVSVAPSSNASSGAVGVSSGSSAGAVAASAGASRGR